MNVPFWRWIVLLILLGALVLAAADLLIVTLSILLLMFAGVLFGIFINAIAGVLAGHTALGYRWAYIIVVSLMVVILFAGLYFMGSRIAGQASELWSKLDDVVHRELDRLDQYDWIEQGVFDEAQIQEMFTSGGGVLPRVMTVGNWLLWGLTGIIVALFVGLYVAFDPHLYTTGLVKLVPVERRPHAQEALDKLHTTLGRWIVGRLISMSIIGVLTAIGLWILGVPLPITLGVLAALLTFIPNIGPILAAIPQVLLALNVGTTTALYVIIFNIVLQGVESYLVTPIVQRYEVTLPPALTIMVQLLMTVTIGVIGIITAAPLTAAALILVQTLYIRDKLGDNNPGKLTDRT